MRTAYVTALHVQRNTAGETGHGSAVYRKENAAHLIACCELCGCDVLRVATDGGARDSRISPIPIIRPEEREEWIDRLPAAPAALKPQPSWAAAGPTGPLRGLGTLCRPCPT